MEHETGKAKYKKKHQRLGNEYKIRFQRWKRQRERKEKTVTYGLYVLYVMGKKGERKQDDCSNVCR